MSKELGQQLCSPWRGSINVDVEKFVCDSRSLNSNFSLWALARNLSVGTSVANMLDIPWHLCWILFRRMIVRTYGPMRMRDHENATDQCCIQVYIHFCKLDIRKILHPHSTKLLCPAWRKKTILYHDSDFLCECWLGYPSNEIFCHILNLWCSSTCWPSVLVSSNRYSEKMASPSRKESYTLHWDRWTWHESMHSFLDFLWVLLSSNSW